jgi:predicted metalloprotease with PDZ domain
MTVRPYAAAAVLAVISVAAAAAPQTSQPPARVTGPMALTLDARDTPRRLLHVRLEMPVTPGPLTLVYPKWLPGEHAPDGPIDDIAGLSFSAASVSIPWRRDPVDLFAFHLDVPPGTTTLDVAFDFLSAVGTSGFSSAASETAHLGLYSWNQVVLYPQGARTDDVVVHASLQLPERWSFATALHVEGKTPERIDFAPVSLTTLVDSPVLAGEYFKTVPLDRSVRPVEIDLAADAESALAISPELTGKLTRLVREADALFGARHFDGYHFLLTLSDRVAHFGLEHHESNDSRLPERAVVDQSLALNVVAHEFVHSWNGKYRQPAGLATSDFQQPMTGELLWIYEGLTQYLGNVLAVRSGLWSAEYFREQLAYMAAYFDHESGRRWRSLGDASVSGQLLYDAPAQWASYRRGPDFYDEGALLWLEVDARIRQLTGGRRSIDDFCRSFYGGGDTGPITRPYTLDDVITALSATARFDWRAFLAARVDALAPHPPLGALTDSGWRIAYTDTTNAYVESVLAGLEPMFSLGMRLGHDGTISDVVLGSPADQAGLGPGMQVISINGDRWSADRLHDALKASTSSHQVMIEIQNDDVVKTVTLEYAGGIRQPHLERVPGAEDVLATILAPRAR